MEDVANRLSLYLYFFLYSKLGEDEAGRQHEQLHLSVLAGHRERGTQGWREM